MIKKKDFSAILYQISHFFPFRHIFLLHVALSIHLELICGTLWIQALLHVYVCMYPYCTNTYEN